LNPSFEIEVEHPPRGRSRTSHVVIRGWCYERHGAAIRGIRLACGRREFHGVYGDARPNLYGALFERSGHGTIGFQIPVALRERVTDADIQVQLPDAAWHRAHSLTLRYPAASERPDRDWRIFWRLAWRGEPRAWDGLTEEERDYAFAMTRVRRWFNLSVEAQYAPRPVALETFPTSAVTTDRLPRLTVVTPSMQQAPFLEQTMDSVLNQSGIRIDYIVQDGGSTDGSPDIIRRYGPRLASWESRSDRGQSDAIARGFARATGAPSDVMMFLNSDDVLLEGAARFVADYFAAHPEVDVVYGHRVMIDDTGLEIGRWFTPRPASLGLAMHDLIPQETLFWRRRIWDRAGGIDPSFQFALDWDLLLRFEAAGARFARLPWFLAAFRVHSEQKTHRRWQDVAMPEIQKLRRRTLGRSPSRDDLHLAMRRAQVDSALVGASHRRGRRL
jgi:GT2 family glycosyltransferase